MASCLVYATWNRANLLRGSLERLSGLTIPDEILVIDDGSVDETEGVCRWARDELDLPIEHVYNHRPYEAMCSQAKNVAVQHTNADVMIFSEPEMLFDTDVVAQLISQHEIDMQWGTRRLLNVGTIHHEQAPGSVCSCGCGGRYHTTMNWQALWVALIRREWLLDVGGWDEHFPSPWGVDDVDLGTRLRIYHVGQHNVMEAEATHQWHPPRNAGHQGPNWRYFEEKDFNGKESLEHPRLRANAGEDWGRVIPRP